MWRMRIDQEAEEGGDACTKHMECVWRNLGWWKGWSHCYAISRRSDLNKNAAVTSKAFEIQG